MDTTQNEVPTGQKRKIAVSLALLAIALALVGVAVSRNERVSPDPMGVRTDKKVLAETRYLAGVVEGITQNGNTDGMMTVRATVKDMNTGGERYIEPEDVRMIEKVYKLQYNKNTVFSGKEVAEIMAGDRVAVTTKERIYENDTVTALSVTYFDPKEETIARILGDRRMVAGVVTGVAEERDGVTVMVRTQIPDEAALRELDLSGAYLVPQKEHTYAVKISADTQFAEGATSDQVKEDARVIVVVDGDVYSQMGSVLSALAVEIE